MYAIGAYFSSRRNAVVGCSFMIHVRHAAAAIASGLCETVLITHGDSGRSGVARTRNVVVPTSLAGSPLPSLPRKRGREGWGWADRAADFVQDPGAALYEHLRPDARAIGDGLGRAARMGGKEPARHLPPADHRRGCAEFADDRLPVPLIAVLPGDRWRRRKHPKIAILALYVVG